MPTNPSSFTTMARLGKEPKVFYINNGNTMVVGLNLAIDDDYVDGRGEWRDQTVWTYGEVFGKRAEYVANNLHVGDKVYVNGKIKMGQGQNGEQWIKFWLNDVRLIDRPGNKQQSQPRGDTRYNDHPEDEDLGPAFPSEASDMYDVPF